MLAEPAMNMDPFQGLNVTEADIAAMEYDMSFSEHQPQTDHEETAVLHDHGEEDSSLLITEEEHAFALQIRRAVEEDEELRPLTDFEYAQYAIVTKGNLQEALSRIHGMQAFRDEYGINNSVQQCHEAYVEHFRQFPGYVLHFDIDESTQEPIVVLDLGRFKPNKTMEHTDPSKHPDFNWRVEVTRSYYQTFFLAPSLAAIRQGVFSIIDCQDIGWDNFTIEYSQRYHSELWGHQPLKFKNLLCYNTGSVANICWSMIKHLMNANMRETLQLGCQLVEMDGAQNPQRLSELYLQPNMQHAHEKMMHKMAELVELRNQNEQKFRL